MAKKLKKTTKKFQKTQLAHTIKERKARQQARRADEKQKQRSDDRRARKDAERKERPRLEELPDDAGLGDDAELDVDSFLRGELIGSGSDDDSSSEEEQSESEEEEEEDAAAAGSGSESGSESSDEDGEDDEAKLERDMARHKAALARMAKEDPAFHKHLMADSAGLLEFGEGESDAEDDAIVAAASKKQKKKRSADEDAAQLPKAKRARTAADADASSRGLLTNARLAKVTRTLAKEPTLSSLRQLLKFYRAACHTGEDDDDAEGRASSDRANTPASAAVFNNVVRFSLGRVPGVLAKLLGRDEAAAGAPLKSLPAWKSHERAVQSYVTSTVHFLGKLVEPAMVEFVLRQLGAALPYFVPFSKLCTKLARALLRLWSSSESVGVRVESFLRLRELVLESPPERRLLDQVLKDSYLAYVRNSQFTSAQSLPHIQFMANCIVELYGLDQALAYQHAFVYVRQLAIHLRTSIVSKEKDAHKGVYNWSFVNCLRVWALLLARHGAQPDLPLRALVYPLVQVCLGTVHLVPSSRHFPLRLEVARYLVDLAEQTRVFVPLAPELLSVLDAAEFRRRPSQTKGSKGKAPELAFCVKVSKKVVATQAYQQAVLGDTLSLLTRYYTVHSHSVSFPELVVPARALLRKFAKGTRIAQVRKQLHALLDKVDRNSQWVVSHRAKLNVAPKDLKGDGRIAPNERSPLERWADTQAEAASKGTASLEETLEGLAQRAGDLGAADKKKKQKKQKKVEEEDEEDEAEDEDEDEEEDDEDMSDIGSDEEPEDDVRELVLSDEESD